jgi:ELWxxDGT repeat protein
MAANQRLGTQGLDRQTWLGLGFAGLAVAVTISLLNGLLSPPRQVLAQARPMLLESTTLADGSDHYLPQGDRLYSVRQVMKTGGKTLHDELWVKDGLSEKRIHSWPDRDQRVQLLGGDDRTLLLSGAPGELWVYDGTVVQPIAAAGQQLEPFAAMSLKGQVIWSQNSPPGSNQGSNQGSELWRLDGKVARSIYKFPSPNNGETSNVYPQFFTPLQDKLVFTTGIGGGLWQTDGQTTSRIAEINPAGQPFTRWGNDSGGQRVFMEAETKTQGWELWTSDGKTAQSLGDLNPGLASSAPQILGGKKDLLFLARTPKGHELFATRGTIATTRSVKVLNSKPTNLLNPGVASLGDRLFFAVDAGQGTELWVSDGTTAQTQRLASLPVQSGLTNLTAIGDRVIFSATDRNGNELWSSDGTVKGTRMVRDLAPGSSTVEVMDCNSLNQPALPMGADNGFAANGFVSPGPPQGGPPPPPCLKRRSVMMPNSASPQQLTAFKGQVYFLAAAQKKGQKDQDLWVTDGTDRGTRLIQSSGFNRIMPLTNWLEIRGYGPDNRLRTWTLR